MNKELQRIAIAKACGWREPFTEVDDDLFATHYSWIGKDGISGSQVQHIVPDYLNDLNACHEVEEALVGNQPGDYVYELSEICCPISGEEWLLIHATAAQRCEAFLKTLGLYKETK